MLLHEHPVNVEREKNGRPPVNSLWFSTGGVLPRRASPAPSIWTFANAGAAIALAAHTRTPARPVPGDIAGAFDIAPGAQLVVVALASEVAVSEVERSWAAPARDALATGRLAGVSILAQDAGCAFCWQASRPRLWQRIAGRARHRDLAAEIAAAMRT
jgi:hypothetical protein